MRYPDEEINSVGDLLRALKKQAQKNRIIWFRGHGRSDWLLVPSLARKEKHLMAEMAVIKRFMQDAVPHLKEIPVQDWEWMFLMQHHRAPTRLLDWSESPLAAMYFAVSEERHKRRDGAVWCLDPVAMNEEAHVAGFKFANEIPAFGMDTVLENYLPNRVDKTTSIMKPVAIVGPRNTPRMAAQLGVFTINHRDHAPIEVIGAKEHAWRWIIPAAAKKDIKTELKQLGFSALTLFPELDRVADLSKELLT